jgi:hypothetical protein
VTSFSRFRILDPKVRSRHRGTANVKGARILSRAERASPAFASWTRTLEISRSPLPLVPAWPSATRKWYRGSRALPAELSNAPWNRPVQVRRLERRHDQLEATPPISRRPFLDVCNTDIPGQRSNRCIRANKRDLDTPVPTNELGTAREQAAPSADPFSASVLRLDTKGTATSRELRQAFNLRSTETLVQEVQGAIQGRKQLPPGTYGHDPSTNRTLMTPHVPVPC